MVLPTASGHIYFKGWQANHLRREQVCRSIKSAYDMYVDGKMHTFLISSALR